MQGLKNHFILFFKSNITVINDKKNKTANVLESRRP